MSFSSPFSSPSKSFLSFSSPSTLSFSSLLPFSGQTSSSLSGYLNRRKLNPQTLRAYEYFCEHNTQFSDAHSHIQFNNRTVNVNPANLILWDNDYVYKIAPWNIKTKGKDFGIKNEVKAYTIFQQLNKSNSVHVPKMISFQTIKIEGQIYALLIITRNQEVKKNTTAYKNEPKKNNLWRYQNQNQKKSYIILAEEFLDNYGITHNDLFNNVFVINHQNKSKKDTFFIIDFEQATFNIIDEELMYIFENLDKLEADEIPFISNIPTIKKKRQLNSPVEFNSPSKKLSFGSLFVNSPNLHSPSLNTKNISLYGYSPNKSTSPIKNQRKKRISFGNSP